MMETVLFYLFGTIAVIAAISVVACRRVFYSAVSLIVCLCSVSALYMILQSPFIAAVQIIVYAGAILVLYLFVVMLLNLRAEESYHKQYLVGLVIGLGILIEAVLILSRSGFADRAFPAAAPPPDILAGNTEVIGRALYTTYLFPFEVASLILLVAMIGAIILAKKGMFDRQTVGSGLKPAPTDRKTD